MRRNWRSPLGLVLMVVVLVAAACGGDDGGASEESSGSNSEDADSISEDDWQDEVTGLCDDWSEEVDDVDILDEDSVADLSDATTQFGEDVEDLGQPDGIEDEAEELVENLDVVAEYLEVLADGVEDFDFPDLEENQAVSAASEALVELGEDLDLDCDLTVIEGMADDGGGFGDSGGDSSDAFSDFTDDFSADLSDDFSDDAGGGFPGEALDPAVFITEYGSDANFDALANACYAGDLAACDNLYLTSPVDPSTASYEGYGATCGGRLPTEQPNQCVAIGG